MKWLLSAALITKLLNGYPVLCQRSKTKQILQEKQMLKHIGKQGDRKIAIVFREVPGEEHMALVVYPDLLNSQMHDSLMQTIESPEGQAAENLGDAMHRRLFPDGRAQLLAMHQEGMIKKVQTGTITVTPTNTSHVRLDELNSILREMKTGEEAVKRMAEVDADAG